MLVISWGSAYSAARAGVGRVRAGGGKVAHAQLRYLSPFPSNMATVLSSYETVLVPELNNGQLSRMLRAEFLKPIISYNKMQGAPFGAKEIERQIKEVIDQ